MGNLLNQQPDYVLSQSRWGTTRKYLYESGMLFREFKSHWKVGVFPLVHITIGVNPETGKRLWANGVIAIGRKAIGVVAIGQAAFGVIAIGQLSIALAIGLGQLSIAGFFSIGQAAAGAIAIGQFAMGYYTFGQLAVGKFVLSITRQDFEAVGFFKSLLEWARSLLR